MKRKGILVVLLCFILTISLVGCNKKDVKTEEPEKKEDISKEEEIKVEEKGTIVLSTTTSTEDSGLLEYILPNFTEKTGWQVDTIAVGTGAALQMGKDGEADVLLVHAKSDEEKFVEEGYGVERFDVMYNDFIILGPKDGEITYNENVEETFKNISESNLPFVSRGDDSGTHKKELKIWEKLNIDPSSNSEYISAGQGMGATLGMAAEKNAYCLSDRATWLTFEDKGDLEIVCEKSEDLLNFYGVIAVNPEKNDTVNLEGAQAFVDWIISPETQELIGTFGVEEFNDALFTPNAK